MAKVGLTNLHIAPITKNDETGYTAGTPQRLAGAITVDIEPTSQEAKLYADGGLWDSQSAVSEIKVTMEVADISTADQALLLGAKVQADGTVLYTVDDKPAEVAIGFKADTSDGGEELVWLFSGKFSLPKESNKTKGDKVEYTTPSLEGTFGQRKIDGAWRTVARSKDEGLSASVVSGWFKNVPAAGTSTPA